MPDILSTSEKFPNNNNNKQIYNVSYLELDDKNNALRKMICCFPLCGK